MPSLVREVSALARQLPGVGLALPVAPGMVVQLTFQLLGGKFGEMGQMGYVECVGGGLIFLFAFSVCFFFFFTTAVSTRVKWE